MASPGPAALYFTRNRGAWRWRARFRLKSWSGLLTARLSLPNKLRLASLILLQPLLGSYDVRTRVAPPDHEHPAKVRHWTYFYFFGRQMYASEKALWIAQGGAELSIAGHERTWPLLRDMGFGPWPGQIEPDLTRASYRMPLLGLPCDARTWLDGASESEDEGRMLLEAGFLSAELRLTPQSLRQLRARFATGTDMSTQNRQSLQNSNTSRQT